MAEIKKYLSLDGLSKYDVKIKEVISAGDEATLASAKGYADGLASNYEPAGSVATAKSELEGKIATVSAAAQTADGKAVAAQNDVDALETLVGTLPEDTSAKSVVDYVNLKTTGIATDAALGELRNQLSTTQSEVSTIKGDYLKAADKTELDGKITAEANRAKGVESGLESRLAAVEADYLVEADKTELQGNIDTVSGIVNTLVGTDTGKSVRTIANEELAAQLIPENASESLNTLQEIAAWIQNHPGDASAMNKAIEDLETLVGTLPEGVTASTIVGYIQEAVGAEKSRAEGVESGLNSRLAAVEGAVGSEGSVKEMIDSAVAAEAALRVAGDEAATSKANQALVDAKKYTDDEIDKVEATVTSNTSAISGVANRVTTAEGKITALEGASHTHTNKAQLDLITAEKLSAWDDAATKAHTHANKDVIDAITSVKVSAWDAAEQNAKDYTDSEIAKFVPVTSDEINAMFA